MIDIFCRQVRARSAENQVAIRAVRELPGQMVAILRQELDSLVRVVYLLAQNDREYRNRLIEDSVSGRRWRQQNSNHIVTDREMVNLTDTLHGWTKSVYAFGCAFIHLSGFHDYQARDPMALISQEERSAILSHLRYYHGGPITESPSFRDIGPFLPSVFNKIARNLECYIESLEQGGDLERYL